MIKANPILFILFLFNLSTLNAQNISKILVDNQWFAYDNFAIVDFQEDGKAVFEYAYCSYCKGNIDTLDWKLTDQLFMLGGDSLSIKTANSSEIITEQYGNSFIFKNIKKIKASKLKKEAIINHLVGEKPLSIKVNSTKFKSDKVQTVQFKSNGKMWLEDPKYRGQWAVKTFYGQHFLIYINRFSVNRDFPLLKIKSLKKGKLIGQPIPSITKGSPFVLEISKG